MWSIRRAAGTDNRQSHSGTGKHPPVPCAVALSYLPLHISKKIAAQLNWESDLLQTATMSFSDPLQGTEIIPLLTSALKDELHWKTPDQFNPSHFLDADGNFVRREAFIPFSIGERDVCAPPGARLMAQCPPSLGMYGSWGHRT